MLRISFEQMKQTFNHILLAEGMAPDRAGTCARIFAENSLDGVYSHGLNRFPLFIKYIRNGYVQINGKPTLTATFGAWEQWNGNLGPGPLNALAATKQAMQLARQYGMGCVALHHTNHWMRGGTFGWHAANAGFGLIAWTNTKPNMPAYNAKDRHLGNNPLVLAVPRPRGHIVLDMAMSQYSLGRIRMAARSGELLNVPGGYDEQGRLTQDAAAIATSGRVLPIGYWKGSGLALLLDLMSALLSGGLTTVKIGRLDTAHALSQVFIAFDMSVANSAQQIADIVDETITDLHMSQPDESGQPVCYPGERTLRTRQENLECGIPVDENIWEQVLGWYNQTEINHGNLTECRHHIYS